MNIMVKTIHTPMMLVAGATDRKRNAADRRDRAVSPPPIHIR